MQIIFLIKNLVVKLQIILDLIKKNKHLFWDTYFPIQNLPKIFFKRSSLDI